MKKKIGLALGGGGARGVAHIGVLKVLEENKTKIDMISGTSMGAVIGALYAANPNAKNLEKKFMDMPLDKGVFDYKLSKKGLIKGKKVKQILDSFLQGLKFEDLRIPLKITAFDIENNREVVFSKGDVAKAVMASISLPGLFFPVKNENMLLIDGGVVDPLPVEIISKEAKKIIAVDAGTQRINEEIKEAKAVDSETSGPKNSSAWNTLLKTFGAMTETIYKYQSRNKDIDVLLKVGSDQGLLDFSKKESMKSIRKGEKEARRKSREIKKLRGILTRIFGRTFS